MLMNQINFSTWFGLHNVFDKWKRNIFLVIYISLWSHWSGFHGEWFINLVWKFSKTICGKMYAALPSFIVSLFKWYVKSISFYESYLCIFTNCIALWSPRVAYKSNKCKYFKIYETLPKLLFVRFPQGTLYKEISLTTYWKRFIKIVKTIF